MIAAISSRAIEIASIHRDDRLRSADPATVEVIAASMAAVGQIEAIVVRPHPEIAGDVVLVAGLHRLEAALRNGAVTINAELRDLTADEARLVEIDENLMRRELGPLDRAIFLGERKKVWQKLYPFTKNGGDTKTKQKQKASQMANLATWSFSKEAADKTGLSERSIRRATALLEALSPDVLALVRGTYLANHAADLEALAAMAPAEQLAAATKLAAGDVRRLSALRPAAQLPADEIEFQKLLERWTRTGSKARKRFLRHIGAQTSAKAPSLRVVTPDFGEAG